MTDWMTLEETREACRKLYTRDGRRPHGAFARNGETEFRLFFVPLEGHHEAYGVLPVEGGLLLVYGS